MSAPAAELLTPGELADELRVSPRTLANWRYLGVGPAFTRVRGRIRYRRDDVAAWLDGQHVATA